MAADPKGSKPPGPDEEISQEVLDFISAIDDYKRRNNRPFPTWSEVLGILHKLGYRKLQGEGTDPTAEGS